MPSKITNQKQRKINKLVIFILFKILIILCERKRTIMRKKIE